MTAFINKITRLCCLLLLASLLSACGFKLQPNFQLPLSLQHLKIVSHDEFSQITRQLRNTLLQHRVRLSQQPDITTLQIDSERFERGTLSLFSSGQVAEYELIYTLSYKLIPVAQPAKTFKVVIRRDYLDDPLSAQAKSRERNQLLAEIRQQAAQQIIFQLNQLN